MFIGHSNSFSLCAHAHVEFFLGADSEELDSDDLDEEEEFEFLNSDEELDSKSESSENTTSQNRRAGSLTSYMSDMDNELAATNIGRSFINPQMVYLI